SECAVPNAVEQSYRGMQHDAHGRQFDHARGALERMEGTEYPVDPVRRSAVALQYNKVVRGLTDQFTGLGDELLLQGAHGATPVRAQTCRTSSASATGLTR